MNPEERAAAWRQRLLSGERKIAAAWYDGQIVGAVSWTPGAVNELNTLYLRADQRGTGLAARLLDASIADGPAGVWIFDGNARAERFYEKHGFQLTGERAIDAETEMPEQRLRRL
jgi:GNAT superfamily N-acetyltransferase